MEIAALFDRSIVELNRYRQTRLAWSMSLPLAVFLGIASLAAEEATIGYAAIRVVLAWMLVLQFRLGNDLSHVQRDRREHPDRVLPRAESLCPFQIALGSVVLANGLLIGLLRSPERLLTFVALSGVTLAAGVVRDRQRLPITFRYHLLLIKYPLFATLIATGPMLDPPQAKLFSMALVYFCFCVYEGLHDERLRADPLASATFHVDYIALAAVAAGIAWHLHPRSIAAVPIQAVSVGGGGVVLATLFVFRQRLVAPGPWCYAVFAPCFFWLLSCQL